MGQEAQKEEVKRLSNRHLAKLLDKLDEIKTNSVTKDLIKRQIYLLSKDIQEQVILAGGKNEWLDKIK